MHGNLARRHKTSSCRCRYYTAGRTACVVPNAKFAASVDPSLQTSGPEAVDAGQSSAPKARYKGGGDADVIGVCQVPREAARCMLGCRGACAGCGGRCAGSHAGRHARKPQGDATCSSARACGPSEARLRPAPSGRHPWPTQVAPHAAHRCQSWLLGKSTVPHSFSGGRKIGTAEWRSWQQDAIA